MIAGIRVLPVFLREFEEGEGPTHADVTHSRGDDPELNLQDVQ